MPETQTLTLPLLPLSAGVVLPQTVVTVAVESAEARDAADGARVTGGRLLLVPGVGNGFAAVGTIGRVECEGELPGGQRALVARDLGRALVGAPVPGPDGQNGVWVTAEPVVERVVDSGRARELAREYRAVVRGIGEHRGAPRLADALAGVDDVAALADTAGWSPDLHVEQKLELLETLDPEARLAKALAWAKDALAELDVSSRFVGVSPTTSTRPSASTSCANSWPRSARSPASRATTTRSPSTAAASTTTRSRTRCAPRSNGRSTGSSTRASRAPSTGGSARGSKPRSTSRGGVRSQDSLDITAARAVLDADHNGLGDVKDRIVEYLAVRRLRAERGMNEAPAAVTARPTWGRGPGRIVRALTDAGTMNPVVVLDEVDKLGANWRGDPSSALLEVLDPAQNHTFRDHYLEVDLDLSDALFVATANVVETIPGPLLDRLEVIRLDGYTEDEKVAIARDHLLPRQLERNGLRPEDVTVSDEVLRTIVVDAVAPTLGRPRFFAEVADRTGTPGVATGLAVTGTGGDVLFVEANATDGEGLTLTGQLGDVVKESAQVAVSYVQAHAHELGIASRSAHRRFHVHVPAGAIPKDGPSAGITITTALVSLLTGRPVRAGVGMTGEVTLQGRVLPIGGVKQKVLAAQRAGLDTVILPTRNGPDLDDVPETVRARMTFHLVDDVRDVLALALAPADAKDARAA